MFCTVCAAINPAATPNCHGCGARLRPLLPTAPRQSSRIFLALLIATPIVALLAVGGAYWQREQAARARWYDRAEIARSSGNEIAALDAFTAATGYRDADAQRARLEDHRVAADQIRQESAVALGEGRYDDAIALLGPLVAARPSDRDAVHLLAESRTRRTASLHQIAADAAQRHDWLTAERALAALAAAAPPEAAVAEQLALLRRHHAPFVFAQEHDLYLTGPDGSDARLLTESVPVTRPLWSPDRRQVAFVSASTGDSRAPAQMYVVDSDGTHLRKVVEQVHPNAVLAWSPDGSRIAYTSTATFNLYAQTGLLAVHVVEVATGIDRDVTRTTGRHAMSPSWSPAGDRLAVISRRQPVSPTRSPLDGPGDITIVALAGGAATTVARGEVPDVVRLLWSPADDLLLVFGRSDGNGTTTNGSDRLLELNLADGALKPVASSVDAASAAWSPAWAPDGQRYAYVDGTRSVTLRDHRGFQQQIATEHPLSGAVSWSPDGSALLAVASDPRDPSAIIDLAGAEPSVTGVLIPYDADWPTGTPQWSPVNTTPAKASTAGTALDQDP